MVAKVTKVDEHGWWVLRVKPRGRDRGPGLVITLPTFTLPKDTRYGDRILLRRDGHPDYGMWRVIQHMRVKSR